MSLPLINIGSTAAGSEESFSSGDERTPLLMGVDGKIDAGYHVTADDKFAMIVDLMNINMDDRTVYLTVIFDYVPSQPEGWDNVKPVWFDVDQCGTSEVEAPRQDGHFVVTSQPWKPNFEVDVLGVGGHLHDGGDKLEILTDDATTCNSQATLGGDPAFISPEMNMAEPMPPNAMKFAKSHISKMSVCYGGDGGGNTTFNKLAVKKLSSSQSWTVKGHYDYSKYPGDLELDGKQASIMAIAIMYVRVPREGIKLSAASSASAAPATAAANGKGGNFITQLPGGIMGGAGGE